MAGRTPVRIPPPHSRAPENPAPACAPGKVALLRSACSTCNLRELCLPCCNLTRAELELANRLAFNRTHIRRGESLFRTDDRFTSLYAVRKGFFKSAVLLRDGRRDQVTGFSMAGEVLGMDGIDTARHTCNAIALEDSDVCAIPFAGLQKLARDIPSLQRQFQRMMSREIVREQGVLLLLSQMTADERLAVFLLNLSQRFAAHGGSPSKFNLRMTREEIGSYLGLSLETVSRTLSKLREEELIGVQQKFIRILDHAGLKRLIGR
ncbi:MAG: helix-turn-helix domain-containing protein [Burkholderiales bacterium]|nr:helix-turn-helix domain-containing protein [Burkholderiales bacterium]